MTKETLTVKNFGPIREAHLDLRKVTVLIGEQASGKSVLAKLFTILNHLDFFTERKSFAELTERYCIDFQNAGTRIHYTAQDYSVEVENANPTFHIEGSFKKLVDAQKKMIPWLDKYLPGERVDLPNVHFQSSTGLQSLTPLIFLIEHFTSPRSSEGKVPVNFIIEEPELNLYPTTQKKLVEYLIEKCTKGDNRLIITTHSPYILTALNNCIQARNTLREHPEHADAVAKLVRPESQIDYEDVMAYYVADGTAKPIMNNENRLIDANALDDVSDELGEIFDRLLDLEMQPA